jgi:pantetheine-phosphate adenylyltransferase
MKGLSLGVTSIAMYLKCGQTQTFQVKAKERSLSTSCMWSNHANSNLRVERRPNNQWSHLGIQKAISLFDELTVAIADNPSKKYTFSLDERVEMAKKIVYDMDRNFKRVHVEAIKNEYLALFAQDRKIEWMVRGVRNERDFSYEREMSHINEELTDGVSTVFLIPPKNLDGVSSSFVKNMVGPKGWQEFIRASLPDVSYEAMIRKFDPKAKSARDHDDICF